MSTALDVAIGLILLYLLLALMVTTAQELVAGMFRLRAKHLFEVIEGMLRGNQDASSPEAKQATELVQKLYAHPLITNLVNQKLTLKDGKPPLLGGGLPSYIPSQTFALALLDVLRGKSAAPAGATALLANARETITKLEDGELKRTLTLLLDDVSVQADSALAKLEDRAALATKRVETWFNDRMARASGWYKRNAQFWSFLLAVFVTVGANADTLYVAQRLWSDSHLRSLVVESAGEVQSGAALTLKDSGLPIGWPQLLPEPELNGPTADSEALTNQSPWYLIVIGWLITAICVSLGAPFWFDVLNRAIKMRSGGANVSTATGRVESK